MAILTEQIKANTVELNDIVHIARDDQFQSENGSSYKVTIAQLIDAEACCLTGGEYVPSANTINLFGQSGSLSLQIQNVSIFSGGSNSCITNLYLNNVHPCVENINIQPIAINNARTYFGRLSGISGFTVFHTTQANNNENGGILFNCTKLILNTNTIDTPVSFSFLSKNRRSGWYFYDNFSQGTFKDVQEPLMNSPNNSNSTAMAVITPGLDSSNKVGAVMGIVGQFDNTLGYYGEASDSFLSTTTHSNGLNIISTALDGTGFIRFYLGCDYNSCAGPQEDYPTPHIHIDGNPGTKGFIGFGLKNLSPTSLVDINGVNANRQTSGFRNLRLRTSYTPPTFEINIPVGTVCWDSEGIYIKISLAVWRRFAMAPW
jgi:hypothetical protein